MTNQRHTNAEIQDGIESLEADGWTINRDGTITRVKTETKKEIRDPRVPRGQPRYVIALPAGRQISLICADIFAAKFSPQPETRPQPEAPPAAVAAIEQPDEVEVGVWLNRRPETRSRPTGCAHCGGYMLRDAVDNEWRCVQCGRTNIPPRVPSVEELRQLRREPKMVARALSELDMVIDEAQSA